MFRQRTRRFLFILAPVAAIAATGLSIYLKLYGQQTSWVVVGSFAAVLLLCALISSYYTYLRPLKDLNTIGRELLKLVGSRVRDYCKSKGVDVRLNVLMIYRPFKFFFLIRRFRVRWGMSMDHAGDGAAEFGIKKGVAGEARRRGNKFAANMEDPKNKNPNWKFSKWDLSRLKFPEHTLIWSFPVYELDKQDSPTGEILGAVNLDSLQPGAYATLIGDPAVRAELESMMEDLQDTVMKIASC